MWIGAYHNKCLPIVGGCCLQEFQLCGLVLTIQCVSVLRAVVISRVAVVWIGADH